MKLDRASAGRPLEAALQVPAKLLPALRLAVEPFESLDDRLLFRILGVGALEGVDGGPGIGQVLLVEGAEPGQGPGTTARVLRGQGGLLFEDLHQLLVAPEMREIIGELVEQLRVPRIALQRAAELRNGLGAVSLLPRQRCDLAQDLQRDRILGEIGRAAKMLGQGLPVARKPLDVRQREVVGRIVREEIESAGEPQARTLGIPQPIQLQASPLMGDGGPSQCARGQVEAPLLELGDQLPMLIWRWRVRAGLPARSRSGDHR